jgi:hypothetical protein
LEGMARANSLLMYRSKNHYEDLLKREDDDLAFLEKNNLWALYYRTFSFVIDSYLYSGQSENALSEACSLLQKHDKAQLLLQKWEPELIQYEEIRGRCKLHIFWSNLYKQYLQLYLNKQEYDKIEPYCKLLDELLAENDETILMTS